MRGILGSKLIKGAAKDSTNGIPPEVNNWLITPVPSTTNESGPNPQSDQRWLLVLTGVHIIDLQGNNTVDWRRETIYLSPDVASPLQRAIAEYDIAVPAGFDPGFQLDQWAPFAAVSSVFAKEEGVVTAGFAVDNWQLSPFFSGPGTDGHPVDRIFNGLEVAVAVVNNEAWLYRVSYNITLLGRIAFTKQEVIP
jgi:hypothetical protein